LYGYYFDGADSTWTRYDSDGKKDMDTPQPKLQSLGDNLQDAYRNHYFRIQTDYERSFGDNNVTATGVFSRRIAQGILDFPHYEEDWVGRVTYNYNLKYFIESSIAYTGSEKFAPGLRYGTFPSVATGWAVSKENFFKTAFPWVNQFKIRYSLGQVGSDNGIDRWKYISEYTSNNYGAAFGYPFTYYPTINEGDIPVTDATWETGIKQNLGFEMGFFKDMITLNVDLYNEKRINILQDRMRVPAWLGAGTIQANIGSTKSHGFEIDLGFNKTFYNGLNLFATANFSANESRVVYYDEPATKAFNLKVEGKPVEIASGINSYTPTSGVLVEGYYQNMDELFMAAKASGVAAQTGDHLYLDFNGDGNIDAQDYIVAKHPYAPAITWNTKIGANYKNWNARVDFYGISDVQYQMRQGGMFYLYPFSQNKNNALTAHADYWTPENTDASYPTVHYNPEVSNPNYRFSSFSNVDGKYVRLKNIRVGYQFKADALKNIGVSNVEMALTGTNLFTWTDYPLGGDPEGANSGTDFGAYPQLRRYTLELKIVF
jgi:TonB-linked SusC/RagA family outer membrane protein